MWVPDEVNRISGNVFDQQPSAFAAHDGFSIEQRSISRFSGGSGLTLHFRQLLLHLAHLFLHRLPLETHVSPLPCHLVGLATDKYQGSTKQPCLQSANYQEQRTEDHVENVALPCPYSDGRDFRDFYGLLWFVGFVFAGAMALIGWGCCRIERRRWFSGWSILAAGLVLDALGCTSMWIGALPWGW